MKEGLKTKLIDYLKVQGGKAIPHYQLELLCKQWGYRTSNFERRLREAKEIGKNYENGTIKSYYYKLQASPKVQAILNSWKKEEVKTNTLF